MPKETILITEDDPILAGDIAQRLRALHYRVCATTSNARQAISIASTWKPDLVLMDINLPGGMDGIEAAEQIHALQVPVIYLTGYHDGPLLERAKQTNPCGYLLKPFETGDLKVAIEIGLHRHSSYQKRLAEYQNSAAASRLAGLLQICCYCKKIKEPSDHWTQIETYIMQRTDASFSHGMCPECFDNVKRQLDDLENSPSEVAALIVA